MFIILKRIDKSLKTNLKNVHIVLINMKITKIDNCINCAYYNCTSSFRIHLNSLNSEFR